MASQIISLRIVYSTVYSHDSGTDQRKYQSSASLAFVRGIHPGPMNSPHKRPVTRKMFPFDDVIMTLYIWTSMGGAQYTPRIISTVCVFVCLANFCISRFTLQQIPFSSSSHKFIGSLFTLRWRHNGRDVVSNHQPRDCLLNRLFRRRSKKTSKHPVTGFCMGNSPVTSEFPTERASNAEKCFHFMTSPWVDCFMQKEPFNLSNSSALEMTLCFFWTKPSTLNWKR